MTKVKGIQSRIARELTIIIKQIQLQAIQRGDRKPSSSEITKKIALKLKNKDNGVLLYDKIFKI